MPIPPMKIDLLPACEGSSIWSLEQNSTFIVTMVRFWSNIHQARSKPTYLKAK
jgi:hypothetical protein